MAGKRPYGNPVQVSDLATAILDPVLRKRAGISIGLVQSWEEIAGPRLAGHSRPEKIQWPRRMHEDDP
ncbi:MAG: DciA family protein, partial [Mesorhizobium sp.]